MSVFAVLHHRLAVSFKLRFMRPDNDTLFHNSLIYGVEELT